jgi:hypothetical protein
VVLSVTALLFPDRYSTAFLFAQPVLFGEIALILYLLIKGARIPESPSDTPDRYAADRPGLALPIL